MESTREKMNIRQTGKVKAQENKANSACFNKKPDAYLLISAYPPFFRSDIFTILCKKGAYMPPKKLIPTTQKAFTHHSKSFYPPLKKLICQKKEESADSSFSISHTKCYMYGLFVYIMPPMPGLPIGISGLSSFLSQTTHSVVRNMPATLAAFSKATRVTLAGSTTPAARKSS